MVAPRSLIHRVERTLSMTKWKTRRIVALTALLLFGCSPASPSLTVVPASEILSPPDTPTAAPDYAAKIRNAQYQLGATDALRIVQLADGKFEQGAPGGADYLSVNLTDFAAAGDLNRDGVDEVAALVAENYGGTGVFTFLAVYADVNGTLTFQTSAYVDDRPGLNAFAIADGEIFLEALIHATDDPLCCPTKRIAKRYRWGINNQLNATDYAAFTPDGRPRTITIEAPVNGASVTGSVQIKGSVAIAPFENNLVYRIYSIGDVELASGSIAVHATELGGPGEFDTIIALGNILSGATIRVEVQDVSAEDGSLLAMDSVELVVK